MPAPDEPTETSALIKTPDLPGSGEAQLPPQDPGWTHDAIRTAILATAFLVLYAFADLFKYISTIRLIELGLCREHYLQNDPSLVDGNGNVPEHLCKTAGIQQGLAHLRGFMSALDAIVGLLLAIPYGLVVGRLGERLLAGINVLGYLFACAWFLIVCQYWSTFPTWVAVLAPFFRVVGGGSPFLSSLVYSIAAKHVPESKRSTCYFIFQAAQIITSTIATLVTAALLDHGFLFLPLKLTFPLGFLCLLSLVAIRADKSSALEPADHSGQEADNSNTSGSIRKSLESLCGALRNPNVLVLLATVPVAKSVNPIGELTWQYVPAKFGVSLATASRALSISSVECLILLLLILPYVKSIAQSKFAITSAQIDLYFVQYGFLIEGLGCLIMAWASTLVFFISGILVFALGCSTRPALQASLASLVSREHVAVLFTVVAVADGIGSAAGAFIFNWAFAIALGWHNELYLGLPFLIGTTCFVAALLAVVYVGRNVLQLRCNI